MVEIEEVTKVDDELVGAFARLIPQLSSSNPPPTERELAAIVTSRSTALFVARDHGEIDDSARGKGVGEALNRAAIDHAQKAGAKTVDLTSRPSREAANRLYQRLGFKARETNV